MPNFVTEIYPFESSYVKDISLFTNIVVDIKNPDGGDSFAYIADTTAYKLVVYDFKNDDSWVVDQAYFYPYPTQAHFNVNGVYFDFMDGVLGLALGRFQRRVFDIACVTMTFQSLIGIFRPGGWEQSNVVFSFVRQQARILGGHQCVAK